MTEQPSTGTATLELSGLPLELLRDIVEHVALRQPADGARLCLVNSAVQRWVLPILYDSVTLRTEADLDSFLLAARFGRAATTRCLSMALPCFPEPDLGTNRFVDFDAVVPQLPKLRCIRIPFGNICLAFQPQMQARSGLRFLLEDHPLQLYIKELIQELWPRDGPLHQLIYSRAGCVTHLFAPVSLDTSACLPPLVNCLPSLTHLGFAASTAKEVLTVIAMPEVMRKRSIRRVHCRYIPRSDSKSKDAIISDVRNALGLWGASPHVSFALEEARVSGDDAIWDMVTQGSADIWTSGEVIRIAER